MLAPTTRPPRSAIDGTIVARRATVGLLCAVVLAVGMRRHEPQQFNAVAEQEADDDQVTTLVEAFMPPHPSPGTLSPDFLEPLPPLQPATALAETENGARLAEPPPILLASESPYPGAEFPHEDLPPLEGPALPPLDEVTSAPEALPETVAPSPVGIESLADAAETQVVDEGWLSEESEVLPVEPAEYDEDAELAAQLTPQDLLTFSPAVAEISQRLLPEVRAAFALAQHGATHAAHTRFVRVLRRIAQAKDVEAMTERHTRALEEGLRALDEADDFIPAGGTTPTLDLVTIAATHQTPMLKIHQSRYTLPHEAVALYHRYAQQKLGAAVEGEQAGSMALHGLGKIYARWVETEEAQFAATRHGMTMYRAALVAHPRNHLAANELGVLLARSGRYDQAVVALQWATQLAGTATIYRNLAVVQQHRGQLALAQTAKAQADQLAMLERASGEVSRRHGIQWVAPQDLARVSDGQTAPKSTAPVAAIAPLATSRQSTITPAPRGGTWR